MTPLVNKGLKQSHDFLQFYPIKFINKSCSILGQTSIFILGLLTFYVTQAKTLMQSFVKLKIEKGLIIQLDR